MIASHSERMRHSGLLLIRVALGIWMAGTSGTIAIARQVKAETSTPGARQLRFDETNATPQTNKTTPVLLSVSTEAVDPLSIGMECLPVRYSSRSSQPLAGYDTRADESVVHRGDSLTVDELWIGDADQPTVTPETVLSTSQSELDELVEMALANNPAIGRALARVEAARGNCLQVGLPPNPQMGYEGQQLGSGGLAEQHGVLISQEIVRGGKLKLNRAVARQELAHAEQNLAIERLKVQTDVRLAYYNARVAQLRHELADKLVAVSQAGSTAVDTLLRIKEANRADVLQAQLEVENAQIVAQAAVNRKAAAWTALQAVIGASELAADTLDGDVFGPPLVFEWESVLSTLYGASPEVSAALAEVCRARFALERAQVEPVPNITVQGLINVIDNGIGGGPDGGVAITFPIPVLNRNQGAISQTRHELSAAEQSVQLLELDLKSRLATVYERYSNARFQFERYRSTILPAAEESLEVSRKLYEAGETNYLALLTAQRSYFQVNLNFLEAVLVLRSAESEIDGFLLSGSLGPSE